MQIQEITISEITVGERYRKEEGNLDELAESIKSKGLLQPVTLDTELNLVAGERRLRACKRAKLTTIPAIVRTISGEIDAREIELFENIHRKQMTWQEEHSLVGCIHELQVEKAQANGKKWKNRDTAKFLGVSDADISQKVALANAIKEVPELAKSASAKEARKKLKRALERTVVEQAMQDQQQESHKYLKWAEDHYKIGDAIKSMSKMSTGIMDFAEVDPPYAINLAEKTKEKGTGIEDYNEVDPTDYPAFISQAAAEVYRVLHPDRWAIWWFGIEWYSTILANLTEVGFNVDPIPAIWCKTDSGGVTNAPQHNLARCYEPFFICRKGVPDLRERGRSNTFHYKPLPAAHKAHPTERPVPLIREILNTFLYPGAKVMVPFLGSGNTIIAAYSNGCNGFGWDLSENYKKDFLVKVHKMFQEAEQEESKE